MSYFKGFCGHLKTICRHRHQVAKNCFRAGIYWQGITHDLSKFSPTEFWQGVKHYQGYRSPNESERELKGYSEAWLHHKGRNRHHFEYWSDISLEHKKYMPVQMPWPYLVEMFCDRVGASKIYYGDKYTDSTPLEYFTARKDKYHMHPETAQQLEFLLLYLSQFGEDKTFKLIRSIDPKVGLTQQDKD